LIRPSGDRLRTSGSSTDEENGTMDTIILGDGPLGQAIGAALLARGDRPPRLLGRPAGGRHDPPALTGGDVVFDASAAGSVVANIEAGLSAGCRRFVIATTGWQADVPRAGALLERAGAAAVVAPNLAIGSAVFLRLVEEAARLFAPLADFEPYVLEWHRRAKADRPSGTAREIVRRIANSHPGGEPEVAVIRAGAAPGMHLVGFDASAETIELRLTARDRSGYATGALAAADWLLAATRAPGIHSFDEVVDDLLAARAPAAASQPVVTAA
jgi:4-hydroxy-tetrahydrodipicolinate reductase